MKRPSIIAVLCLFLTLLAGCSALRIGYNQAPTMAYWWLDGYVDFDDAQAPRAKEALKDWFAWHRRTQLPDYAALLARGQAEIVVDTTSERACAWYDEARRRVDVAVEQALPAAADLLVAAQPRQIAHLETRYAKFNAEFRDEYLQPDPAKRREASARRAIDRAESLYGRLDEPQRERVKAALDRSPFDAELWFAERRQRQQDALAMLRAAADGAMNREQALVALRGYADHMARSPRPAYRDYAEALLRFNCDFAASLHNATTASQRQKAAAKFKGWEDDLRALAAARP